MDTQILHSSMEDKHNVLYSLPAELVHNIWSDWIDSILSLFKIDTAVCQHAIRGLHLAILSSEQFYVSKLKALSQHITEPDPDYPTTDTQVLHWLLARNVKVREIEFAYDCQISAIFNYLKKLGKNVRKVKHYTPIIDFRNPGDMVSSMLIEFHARLNWPGGFGFDQDKDSQGNTIATYCKNLISYRCHMLGMSDEGFVRVLSSNPGLQELQIEGDRGPGNAASIEQVSLPNLRQLVFMTKYGFNEVLTAFACAAPNLEKLMIACNSYKCTELPRGLIVEVGQRCSKLRSFSSRELDLGPNDGDLKKFLQMCPNIVNLDLQSHFNLSDDTLIEALSCLNELRSINLSFCSELTDRTLLFLSERFAKTLQVLYIGANDGMTQKGTETLRAKCTQLHTFHCVYNCGGKKFNVDKLKRATILRIVYLSYGTDTTVLSTHDQQLQVLDLSEGYRDKRAELLSAAELIEIARVCSHLHTVVLSEYEYRKVDYSSVKKAFPKLVFTTDKARADFDVLAMPV